MKITIRRTELQIIFNSGRPIDEHVFESKAMAGEFLSEHVPQVTTEQLTEIFTNPYTSFEVIELINRGIAIYSGRVIYEIEINSQPKECRK